MSNIEFEKADAADKFFTMISSTVLLTCVLLFLLCSIISERSYKAGQLDILIHNKVQYELVVKPDSTRSWEKIKK